jgi:heme/copper-type cytochrome/quinol oxidase subunit 2
MKNFISTALISSICFLPLAVSAIAPGTIPEAGELGIQESPIETAGGLLSVIADVVRWVYILFFIVAVMFILFAAFNYLTAGGEAEKIKTSHRQIIYAIIAIAVALLAVGVTAIIQNFLQSGRH